MMFSILRQWGEFSTMGNISAECITEGNVKWVWISGALSAISLAALAGRRHLIALNGVQA